MDVDVRRQQRGGLRPVRHGPGRRATDGTLQAEGFVFRAEVAPDLAGACRRKLEAKQSWIYVVRGHLKYMYHIYIVYKYMILYIEFMYTVLNNNKNNMYRIYLQ